MKTTFPALARFWPGLALGLAALAASGCSPEPGFKVNLVYLRVNEASIAEGENDHPYDRYRGELRSVLYALFGSPDEPNVPALPDVDTAALLDIEKLKVAAGPVRSDQRGNVEGLFRKHCAHCHGVTGDGAGPTAAFLNPYPRDFRMGLFKFKSTPKGEKPTREDLHRTLMEGIPGTAMPSFRLLDDPDREALLDYVIYLSVRGEVERKLIEGLADLAKDAPLVDRKDPQRFAADVSYIKETAASVVKRWQDAPSRVTQVPQRAEGWEDPLAMAASVERGRRLFYGDVANCVKCHGESQLGDGQTSDYDDWTKVFLPPNATPADVRRLSEKYVALGALEPRHIHPRNLRQGVFRGGRRPVDIYWRVRNGIDGTPMPAALMKPPGAAADVKGLTEEDLWSLVDYVRHLHYEPVSEAPQHLVENERLRP